MVGLMLGCGLVTVKMTDVNLTNAVGIVFWEGNVACSVARSTGSTVRPCQDNYSLVSGVKMFEIYQYEMSRTLPSCLFVIAISS